MKPRISPRNWFIEETLDSSMPASVKQMFLNIVYKMEERLDKKTDESIATHTSTNA